MIPVDPMLLIGRSSRVLALRDKWVCLGGDGEVPCDACKKLWPTSFKDSFSVGCFRLSVLLCCAVVILTLNSAVFSLFLSLSPFSLRFLGERTQSTKG
jgi:hypothetical protein